VPLRSLLFVPADSDRKMRRAVESGADVVIFDFEDAVAPDRKAEARRTLAALLRETRPACFAIRVNGADTDEHLDDLIAAAAAAPDFVMLPKCAGRRDLEDLDARLEVAERAAGLDHGRIRLLPLVSETAASLASLDYRGAPRRLAALVFAGEDLSADLGVPARRADGRLHPLLADARLQVARAAAAAGLPAIDTPHPDPRDADGLARETAGAAELGYGGKLCIHPGQIALVHAGLAPSAERLDWAREVVRVLAGEGAPGVAMVAGAMVDKAHLRLARRILAMGGRDE
jgi:citrate lyase subunit beta/citryl-CoA lyase